MRTRFYSTSEVADMCNVHRNTIIAAIRQGKLRAYKTPGGHARISHADLVAFCKERGLPISRQISRNDKVLIVDADPVRGQLTRAALEAANYRVRLAENLYDGGFLTVAFLPDVLLVDTEWPDDLAEKMVRRTKRSKPTRKVKILLTGPASGPQVNERMLEAGADDFVARPFEMAQLLDHIQELCGPIDRDIPIRDESHFELTPITV